ncbi:MAG: OmpA family protein [Myxococcales bacterium]|nr:OmpA family protein [Myxococcales bacterium]
MTRFALAFAFSLTLAAPALAQRTTLNRFRAAETTDDAFGLRRPEDQGHLRVGAQLHLDYASAPLVFRASDEDIGVVDHQLMGNVAVSLGLIDRATVFVGLPVSFVLTGTDEALAGITPASGPGLGDVYLGARFRIFGERGDFFGLAAQLAITLPTGGEMYRGDRLPTVHPELLAELRPGLLRFTVNVGARIREPQQVAADTTIGNELTFGVGLTAPLYADFRDPSKVRLDLHAQIYGASSFSDFFGESVTAVEALGGFKVHLPSGFVVGAAGGAGVAAGFGSPAARAIFTFGWAQPIEVPPVAEEAPADTDGDGIPDDRDACPSEAEDLDGFEDADGCPDPDNDGDGVPDADDRCPLEAGPAENEGCPDSDADGDGVVDRLDACVDEPEDLDGFEDADGCPDPDNDGDGVLDTDDACPTEAGPAENRGCPDQDRDGDGVVDRLDNCPDEPGTAENQGCVAPQQVRIQAGRLEILDKIFFATNRDTIQQRSFQLLDNVARVLNAHPEITHVRVEGHSDDTGSAERNLDLSQRRAEAVVRHLVQRGQVAAERLSARGYGPSRPLTSNDTPAGRAENRRVEFRITDGAEAEDASTEADAPQE